MKSLTDNGTLLALGLVGVVAVAGALAPRAVAVGSRTVAPAGSLAALTPKARASLPARDFVFPEERAYPIHDARHGQLALTYVAAPSNQHRRYQVMRAVFQRYPSLLAWWNTTNAGRKDPANPNSWRTTLYQYQGSLPRLTDLSERREVEAEIEALQALVASTPRTTRPRRAA